MVNMEQFIPADKSVTRGGKNRKKGSLTIINSANNGRRLIISEDVVEILKLKETVKIGFIGKQLLLGTTLPGEKNEYELRKQGKKKVVYSAELISLITEYQGINFANAVSHTWYSPSVDEVNDTPVVIFDPEGGEENGQEKGTD